jgi:small subunit ribosomal protein S5
MSERKDSLVDYLVSVNRVTKVTKGGKSMSFAALVVVGDQSGKVGIGLGKGREVTLAIAKATNQARKKLILVALRGTTLPYEVVGHHGASRVVLRPAYKGTGVIAGGAVRKILVAVGCKDVLAKALGSRNPQNLVKATLNALAKMRSMTHMAKLRGKTIQELVGGA